MSSNNSNGSRSAWAWGFMALRAVLAMELSSMAGPAAAAPFAYVANAGANSVSVIDTATHTVVATIPVGKAPFAVAVTPNGKHAYVTNFLSVNPQTVSVIRTATNTVVATVTLPGGFSSPQAVAVTPDGTHAYVTTIGSIPGTVLVIDTATNTVVGIPIPVGFNPMGIAITPDGQHAYVANSFDGTVSVISTASNSVVATVTVGAGSDLSSPQFVAITPNGKHVYVANMNSNNVSVIRTASNTVVATSAELITPAGIAITPDGTHAYVANNVAGNVSVIDTHTNTVVANVPVGGFPDGVAVTPDGKHAYVASDSPTVSVIRTATNTVVATVAVGVGAVAVGIIPPPPGVPFLAFSATALDIDFDGSPIFNLHSQFTLSSTAPAINPVTQPVTLQVGTFSTTFPPGSFAKQLDGSFTFAGVIDGVSLKAQIRPTATLQYTFHAKATGASLTGTKNPVYVTLIIGGDSGATSVTAAISP